VRLAKPFAACALAACLLACTALSPVIVQTEVIETEPGLLEKVAVSPFEPAEDYRTGNGEEAVPATLAAELVTRFVTEAISAQGISAIAPNDIVIAFEGEGVVLPRGDAAAVGKLASRQFGATGVVTGHVIRYREREGGSTGAFAPASVAFDLALHDVATGHVVYRARFDHTQQTLSGNLFLGLKYPGTGFRWLSAAELARWGADNAVEDMPPGLR
jgi:hypothetical protein